MGSQSDYLSIGSGVAGLYFAIQAARSGATVSIVTKKAAVESETAAPSMKRSDVKMQPAKIVCVPWTSFAV